MRKQLKKLWMCLNPVYKKTVYQEELLQDIKAALEKLSSDNKKQYGQYEDSLVTLEQSIEVLQSKIKENNTKNIFKTVSDNVLNEEYFRFEQKLYNRFETLKATNFTSIFYDRIERDRLLADIKKIQNRFEKDVVLLTDLKKVPKGVCKIELKDLSQVNPEKSTIVLAFNKDFLALKAIEKLNELNLKYVAYEQVYPLTRYFLTDAVAYQTFVDEVAIGAPSKFNPVDFENIFQVLNATANLPGDYVEIGTFRGASARAALRYIKNRGIKRQFYCLDTFEGFSYDEAYNSADSYWQGTHSDTSITSVEEYLKEFDNVKLYKANIIKDKLPEEISLIAACNIDVDMYDAVKAALYRVKDRLVPNGIIIQEDYGHTPLLVGAQKAVQEFLQENPDMFTAIYMNSGQMLLIKRGGGESI